jgi:hypothetical protein
MLRTDVESVHVVEHAVVGLADDGERPELGARWMVAYGVGNERVADHPHRMRVRDRDGAGQETGFAKPLQPGQLAVPVQPMAAGEDRLDERVTIVRDDHGDARPYRAPADDPRPVAPDERGVADSHARHVRDRVVRAGLEPAEDDAVVACAHAVHPVACLAGVYRVSPGPPRRSPRSIG